MNSWKATFNALSCINSWQCVKLNGAGKTKGTHPQKKSLFRSQHIHLRLPSGRICISALVTRTDGCAALRQLLDHEEDGVISRHGTLIVRITTCLKSCRIGFADQAETCGGEPSRWLTSTAVWCLDTHRTSVGLVCQYQTLPPRIQWQRDVITLCCMKNETGETERERGREVERGIESYYLLQQRLGAFDGGPGVYLCDVKLKIWGSFIHESTSLMLTGWLSCLYYSPQAWIVVKLLLLFTVVSGVFGYRGRSRHISVLSPLSLVSCCSLAKVWTADRLFSIHTHSHKSTEMVW